MSDKKEVDLTALEQGDTVVFRDEERALVNCVVPPDDNTKYFTVMFFMDKSRAGDYPIQTDDFYDRDGIVYFHNAHECDIIEIIKNPKKWTDDDMRAACQFGIARCLNGSVINFRKWLEHYKAAKNDTI